MSEHGANDYGESHEADGCHRKSRNFRAGLLTIYVEEPWTPDSAVALADQPDVSGPSSAAPFDSKPYFMEISTAQEFLGPWLEEAAEKPSVRQQCELIFYALNDA